MAARTGDHHEVTIESIGARGDGVARLGSARMFVPLTVPGDRLHVRVTGRRGDDLVREPVEWVRQASRAEPPCPHFGTCGDAPLVVDREPRAAQAPHHHASLGLEVRKRADADELVQILSHASQAHRSDRALAPFGAGPKPPILTHLAAIAGMILAANQADRPLLCRLMIS